MRLGCGFIGQALFYLSVQVYFARADRGGGCNHPVELSVGDGEPLPGHMPKLLALARCSFLLELCQVFSAVHPGQTCMWLLQFAWKVAPALACGNTIVIKVRYQ
jgi:hypothetical protein